MADLLTKEDLEVISGMAEHNMNITELARDTYQHRNSVDYHLTKILRKTGLDPKRFTGLCKLLGMAKVVQCRDCQESSPSEVNVGYLFCGRHRMCFRPEHFCAYAKRKNGGTADG